MTRPIDHDLGSLEFYDSLRIKTGIPPLDVDGGLALGTVVVVSGDRDASIALTSELATRAAGSGRSVAVSTPLEVASLARIAIFLSGFAHRPSNDIQGLSWTRVEELADDLREVERMCRCRCRALETQHLSTSPRSSGPARWTS